MGVSVRLALCDVFINALERGGNSKARKFADYTKLFRMIKTTVVFKI